jgi:MFS family permease
MWVFMSTVITIGAHALLAFSFLNPYIGTIIMGMAYSMLASSLWPLVALIIPEYQLGTAYGICQSVQNLGLAVVSMFAGYIVDKGGYLMLELFFIGWLSGEFYLGFKWALRVTHVISRAQIPQQSTQVSFSIPKQSHSSPQSLSGCKTSTTTAC